MNLQNNHISLLKIGVELLWVCVAGVVSASILFPITYNISYSYTILNGSIVFLSLMLLRYAVFFKQTVFFKPLGVRLLVLFISVFLFIYVLNRVEFFLQLSEVFSLDVYTSHPIQVNSLLEKQLMQYIYIEFLFFSLLLIAGLLILDIKIIASFWKKRTIRKEQTIYHYKNSRTSQLN